MKLVLLLSIPYALFAQSEPLTLPQAVDLALKNYPSIRVSQEQVNAAAAGIDLARTAYLPRVEALAQVNVATRNNVFGMLLPQSVIPSISGPVLGSNNTGLVWGSAAGVLATWEPFDFGLRKSNVEVGTATRAQAEAGVKRSEFEVAVAAADAYVTLAAAQETVRAAQAGVDRATTVVRTTGALADAELRPGADASRAQAELAAARTQFIQAQQAVALSRASLAQFLAIDPVKISIAPQGFQTLPPAPQSPSFDTAANPIVLEQSAVIEQARAQLRVLERSYFPRFYLQGSAYARGTGAELDGRRLSGLNGLAPTVQDYALGFTVSFPVMDRFALHAKEQAQNATIRAQTARADQIAAELRASWNSAVARLDGARQIAANTPIQMASARTALQQADARYQSGLGTIDAVAEAQRLVTQAEIEDALARLSVWRGLLGVASAAGDIRPFLAEVGR